MQINTSITRVRRLKFIKLNLYYHFYFLPSMLPMPMISNITSSNEITLKLNVKQNTKRANYEFIS
jgi:hypothetical protein